MKKIISLGLIFLGIFIPIQLFAQDFIFKPNLTTQVISPSPENFSHSGEIFVEQKNIILSENSQKKCHSNPEIKTFMYHYIRDHTDTDSNILRSLSVPPAVFEEHMKKISELKNAEKIGLLTGEEFLEAIKNNCFPHSKIWIFTADDGWKDNFYYLAPIAEKYKIPFIFGIVSGKILEENFMNAEEISHLSNHPLFTIASHSITHSRLDEDPIFKAKNEICESKIQLEKIIKKPIKIFVYPYGRMNEESIKFVKWCGYSVAWSTDFGKNFDWQNPDFFDMNRINITPNTEIDFFESKANW